MNSATSSSNSRTTTSASTNTAALEYVTRYGIDFAAAGMASFLVSPFITVVDRAIIENASGIRPLKQAVYELSASFIRSPISFIQRKEFLLIYGLYGATYVTANAIETTCDVVEASSSQLPKFIGTTAVNISLCVAKDLEFTRMFGAITPTAVPLATYGLFALRDSLSVAASFNLPKVFSEHLQSQSSISKNTADVSSQLFCPAAAQLLSSPLHILGLDLYNHRTKAVADRGKFILREYWKSSAARIARIGPAFGLGGISNKYFRDNLQTQIL